MDRTALLVEDDLAIATVIRRALEDEGFAVTACASIAERDRLLTKAEYAVMLTDVILADGDGIESLGAVHERYRAMPVIVISAQNNLDTAVRASTGGAFEYFPKPFDLEELVRAACQAAGQRRDHLPTQPDEPAEALPLIGRSQPMQEVYRLISRVLHNDLSVLVLGESGTGKELVAEAIHQMGKRKGGPFVALNAAAIPRDLIESELFGHEKGAFTGASARAIGKFEQADGGTLFLDEIGDMPPEAQTRLLRALQSGRIRRVGGTEEIAVDVRILAATNRDLAPMIASGEFREDLYYRLNVVPILLPPLRDRAADIAPLARHFLQLAAREGLPARRLTSRAEEVLAAMPWRGNVRELKNFIYRVAILARQDEIDAPTISDIARQAGAAMAHPAAGPPAAELAASIERWLAAFPASEGDVYHRALAEFERPLFALVLRQTGGNQIKAARLLGINRNTLRKRLGELDLQPESFNPA